MRITKAFLRKARIGMTQQINDVFKLDDEKLKSFVGVGMPGITIEETNREELLRMAVHWVIDAHLPDRYVD